MQPHLQSKLLRAIQEREVDRLGGAAPVKIDVRILAATHRDLAAEVRAGRFREDLYFRLNVVTLRIPPLRERQADILPLAGHFAQRYAQVNGLPQRGLSPAAQSLLLGHPWPGNVRELENALHRAVLLAEGREIGPDAIELLAAAPFQAVAEATVVTLSSPRPLTSAVAALVGRKMEEVERDLILETLGHTLGNRTHAATILGISIRALRNKLRDYAARGSAVPPPSGMAA
jgi:DNA-binding NtrC family response regulator